MAVLNTRLTVTDVNGTAPYDGAPLMIDCHKDKGITLYELRCFKKVESRRIDPTEGKLHRSGPGEPSRWTGRRLGAWDVDVRHDGGLTSFGMKNKGEALALISWIEKYAKRKARKKQGAEEGRGMPSEREPVTAEPEVDEESLRRGEFLRGLCLKLNNVRGRATLEDVDYDIKAIIAEIERELERSRA